MVAVAAAWTKRASTSERTLATRLQAAALSNDIMEKSELQLRTALYSSSNISLMPACVLACLPPSFLSPVSGAINSFAFAVKCFACLMSLTFHSDDSFSFCSADMSTPCMSPHVHDPFGRGYFFLPSIHTSSRQAGRLPALLSLDPFNYRWEQVDRDKFGRKAQKASGEE